MDGFCIFRVNRFRPNRSLNHDQLGSWIPPTDRIFTSIAVLDEPYLLAIPEGHYLAKKSKIMPADLDGAPWVTFSRKLNPGAHDRMMAASAKAGFTPDVRYEATDSSTILGLVEAGLGLALIQGSVRGSGPASVIFRALSWFPLSIRVHLVRRRVGLPPLAKQFVDIVVDATDNDAGRCSPGKNRAASKKIVLEPP
jgi:DNA-binding transcriptional LysR family regulator